MSEEVLFESENRMDRAEIASYLHRVAESLEADREITLKQGGESVTLAPPASPTFEVKVEREGPEGGPYERSVEFELEWDENDHEGSDGGGLEIE